jgi:hypothetical protein
LLQFAAIETIKQNYEGFELSDDILNWVHEIGSAGNPTTLRVNLPIKLIGKHAKKTTDLGQLLEMFAGLEPFTAYDENSSENKVLYLEEIEETPRHILMNYANEGVIIEEKPEN